MPSMEAYTKKRVPKANPLAERPIVRHVIQFTDDSEDEKIHLVCLIDLFTTEVDGRL